jgi:hypothetical protein
MTTNELEPESFSKIGAKYDDLSKPVKDSSKVVDSLFKGAAEMVASVRIRRSSRLSPNLEVFWTVHTGATNAILVDFYNFKKIGDILNFAL